METATERLTERRTTAVVIDDHPAVRAGVQLWLTTATPPVQVVDSSADVREAWVGPGAHADVVILDLQLDGPPTLREVRRLARTGRRVIVYTMHASDDLALRSLELGALCYLTKAEGEKHLVDAVRAAAQGRGYTPPTMAGALAADRRSTRPALSAREYEVLVSWFQSDSKERVARRLGISVSTVNSHLERVRMKYADIGREASTKAALVARAIQDELIDVDQL
ncbi:response regulator transcription factor [Actinosynnema sp. NPDC023587]|uniref:response regulator transcription factor n=1 Tax=Actinosynnema sp. NPDC023587 TaxID=3154695 RepID=UPI0033FFAA88